MKATTLDAYKLLHEGILALSQVEANGMKIDMDYLKKANKRITKQIIIKSEALKEDKIVKVWRKRFGADTNLDSHDQLGKVLFEDLDYTCPSFTKTGRFKTDELVLETLGIPFVNDYLEVKKLKKAQATYLNGISREVCNGFIHPVFNLHIAATYRSSSDSPNFQNMPIRNPEMAKLIRRCFIPRAPNRHIVESDYGGIEVHGAAWYHKDPVMLSYIGDPTKDMHRDAASQCYRLSKKEMIALKDDKKDAKRIKNIRYSSKNKFIFPQFYGAWWFTCSQHLWSAIDQLDLHTRKGLTLKEHLHSKGIECLGVLDPKETPAENSFLNHIKKVEWHFWNKRFNVYKRWKDQWYADYLKNGYFDTLTGFRIEGFLDKKKVINYPVQGTAFHCLLWSLIRIQKLLRKYKMKSLIVGQIHDSIIGDVLDKELKNYLEIIHQVMVIEIKKHWSWIITELEVENEVSPAGKSWWHKEVWNDG